MAESESTGSGGANWERTVLEKLARSALDEQRRAGTGHLLQDAHLHLPVRHLFLALA